VSSERWGGNGRLRSRSSPSRGTLQGRLAADRDARRPAGSRWPRPADPERKVGRLLAVSGKRWVEGAGAAWALAENRRPTTKAATSRAPLIGARALSTLPPSPHPGLPTDLTTGGRRQSTPTIAG
jgi:hypothetical protein